MGENALREVTVRVKFEQDKSNPQTLRDMAAQIRKAGADATVGLKLGGAGAGRGVGGGGGVAAAAGDPGGAREQAAALKALKDKERQEQAVFTNRAKLLAQIGRMQAQREQEEKKATREIADAQKQGMEHAKEGMKSLVKATALWGLTGMDSAEKILKGLVAIKAAAESTGIFEVINGLKEAGAFTKGGGLEGAGRFARAARVVGRRGLGHAARGLLAGGEVAAGGLGLGGVGAGTGLAGAGVLGGAGLAALIGGGLGVNAAWEFGRYNLGYGEKDRQGRVKSHGAQTEATANWMTRDFEATRKSKGFDNTGLMMGANPFGGDWEQNDKVERYQKRLEASRLARSEREEAAADYLGFTDQFRSERESLYSRRNRLANRGNELGANSASLADARKRLEAGKERSSGPTDTEKEGGYADEMRAIAEINQLGEERLAIIQRINQAQQQLVENTIAGLKQELSLNKQIAAQAKEEIKRGKQSLGTLSAADAQHAKDIFDKLMKGENVSEEELNSRAGQTLLGASKKAENAANAQRQKQAETLFGDKLPDIQGIEHDKETAANNNAEEEASRLAIAEELKARLVDDAKKEGERLGNALKELVDAAIKKMEAEKERRGGQRETDAQSAASTRRNASSYA